MIHTQAVEVWAARVDILALCDPERVFSASVPVSALTISES